MKETASLPAADHIIPHLQLIFNAANAKLKVITDKIMIKEILSVIHALMWDYDASKINIPVLMLSAVGDSDENFVVSKEQLTDIYDDIIRSSFKMMARRNDAQPPVAGCPVLRHCSLPVHLL